MAASNTIPSYDHIVVVMEENHSFSDIIAIRRRPTSTLWPTVARC